MTRRGGWVGAEISYRGSPGTLLFDAVDKAAMRTLGLVDECDLPRELRRELRASLLRIDEETHARRLEEDSFVAGREHAQWVAGFLKSLRDDLARLGDGQDEPSVLAERIGRIARGLEETIAGELHLHSRPSETS